MLELNFSTNKFKSYNILYLGAHCDDVEIGCGGSILKLTKMYPHSRIFWVVFSAIKERSMEASRSANRFLDNVDSKEIRIEDFRNGFFPYVWADIKEYFESLKDVVSPDIIFTHYRHDLHQDHRVISELTWNTFRNHLILEYEIPKYDGDLGSPNLFFRLDEDICRKKVDYITRYFKTQRDKSWFSRDTFFAMLRLRGVESNSPSKYAEGFYCRKLVL